MGDFLVWLLDHSNGTVLVLIIIGYLLAEFALDIVHDLVLDWIHKKRDELKRKQDE